MELEQELRLDRIFIQKLEDTQFQDAQVDILRLDKIHAVVSGNKWFKLKYYLRDVLRHGYNSVATFGGAFSNHILATAYACKKENIQCAGYIRGEKPGHFSQTLLDAQ